MKLFRLIEGIEILRSKVHFDIDIKNICSDSRKASENFVFVAIKGLNRNGNTYINEALRIKSGTKIATGPNYKYHPKTKEELQDLLNQLIEERGNEGDFNDIDTSEITDMSKLFINIPEFNGDISDWDVSNVKTMQAMFAHSKFNGHISNWNVSNVTNMRYMFCACKSFNQDISNWDVSNVTGKLDMFDRCPIEEKNKPKFK
jgi:surface protein